MQLRAAILKLGAVVTQNSHHDVQTPEITLWHWHRTTVPGSFDGTTAAESKNALLCTYLLFPPKM